MITGALLGAERLFEKKTRIPPLVIHKAAVRGVCVSIEGEILACFDDAEACHKWLGVVMDNWEIGSSNPFGLPQETQRS